MIKAVLFDIDGVLLDSFEANFKFYVDLMAVAGYGPPTKDGENDVQAARAAGMKVIIYSKQTISGADACTSSFTQLPELIQSL